MAGSFLTPAQFNSWKRKNNKPTASYGGYVNWVKKTRASRASAPAAGAGPLPSFSGLLSPQQTAQAKSLVNAQIAQSLAGERAATAAAQAQSNNQAAKAQGYALALGKITADDPSQIAAQYRTSADRLKAYGTGLSGAVLDAQQGDAKAISDQLASVGLDGKVGSYDLGSLRNTALELGTVIPGEGLEQDASRAYSTAAYDREAGINQVGQIAQQYLAKTTDLQNQLATKRAELEASRPGLMSETISKLSDAQRQQRALDVQVGTLQLQQAKTAQEQAIAMTNLTGTLYTVDKHGRVVATRRAAPGSDAGKITATNARAAADRRVKKEIADAANQTKLTVAQTQAAAKKAAAQVKAAGTKPATPQQRSAILKNANAQANTLIKTTVDRIIALIPKLAKQGVNESDDAYKKRYAEGLVVYQGRLKQYHARTVRQVVALISPQLKLLHYGPDQINGYANAIVNASFPQKP